MLARAQDRDNYSWDATSAIVRQPNIGVSEIPKMGSLEVERVSDSRLTFVLHRGRGAFAFDTCHFSHMVFLL